MGMELNYTQMEADMKESLGLERKRGEDILSGEMEQSTEDNLKMDLCKGKVFISFQMVKFMKDSSERTRDMEEENMLHL